MKQFSNITDKFDTKEERKKLRAEHGWWALFLILIVCLPLAYWPELSHLYGFQAVIKVLNPIIALGCIIFVIYKDDPNYDWLKWVSVIVCAFFTMMIMAQASNYRQQPEREKWDYKKKDTVKIYEHP
jgi:hypothetical protein